MRGELWRCCGVVISNALEEEVSRLVLQWPLTPNHSGSLTTEEWGVSTPAVLWLLVLSTGLESSVWADKTGPETKSPTQDGPSVTHHHIMFGLELVCFCRFHFHNNISRHSRSMLRVFFKCLSKKKNKSTWVRFSVYYGFLRLQRHADRMMTSRVFVALW